MWMMVCHILRSGIASCMSVSTDRTALGVHQLLKLIFRVKKSLFEIRGNDDCKNQLYDYCYTCNCVLW